MPSNRPETVPSASQEQRLQRLLDAVLDRAVCLIETDGTIASWNAGAEQLLGHTAADAVGHSFAMLFEPEDQAGGLPAEILNSARERGQYRQQGWLLRRDGSR